MARITNNVTEWQRLAEQSVYNAGSLSKQLKISRRQLQRYTNELFGQSPQTWLNEQRLLQAAELMQKERCAKTVSNLLGFKQVSHFSREFKRYYGTPPVKFLTRPRRDD